MTPPKMATIKETAKLFGLPEHFVRTLCKERKIVAVQAGNKWLCNVDRLTDYLNAPPVPEKPETVGGVRRIEE